MQEKELIQGFTETFEAIILILEDVKKGFFTQKAPLIKESKVKFREGLKSRVPFVEKIIELKEKDETEKRYVNLLLSFQAVALAIENLISKMETKVELNLLFSEKALSEIKELFSIIQTQFRDTKDYVITKNPHLKNNIDSAKEKIVKLAEEYELVHQQRLITGICMPRSSYLYIDITDSLKRIARGLTDFSSKV